MLVMLMPWHSDLGPHAKDQKGVLLKVLKVKHCGWVSPVRVSVELRLHLVLLVHLVSVVLHLVHHWSRLHEVYRSEIDQNVVPLHHVAVELGRGRDRFVGEEKGPELLIFASLFNSDNLFRGLLVLLEELDVLSSLVHIWGEVAIWYVSSLPDVDWKVRARILVASLDDEDSSWIELLALLTQVHVVHG